MAGLHSSWRRSSTRRWGGGRVVTSTAAKEPQKRCDADGSRGSAARRTTRWLVPAHPLMCRWQKDVEYSNFSFLQQRYSPPTLTGAKRQDSRAPSTPKLVTSVYSTAESHQMMRCCASNDAVSESRFPGHLSGNSALLAPINLRCCCSRRQHGAGWSPCQPSVKKTR